MTDRSTEVSHATVLVVDDEPLLRDIMTEWLEPEGYRVLTAENGIAALRALEANRVDVIVTDLRMPGMDGRALLKRLSTADYAPAAILATGFTDISLREAYDLGVEAVLPKPFTYDQLLFAVKRSLMPREEIWCMQATADCQDLRAAFATVESARRLGQIAFGRGGFCVRPSLNLSQGPVLFALNFTDEPAPIAGHGMVRWIGNEGIGVEIAGFESNCLAQGIRLTAGSGARCFIPASPKGSAIPHDEITV